MGQQEKNDEGKRSKEQSHQHGERNDPGRSGEGADSAMRHMISQVDRQRQQSGRADDAAGHPQ